MVVEMETLREQAEKASERAARAAAELEAAEVRLRDERAARRRAGLERLADDGDGLLERAFAETQAARQGFYDACATAWPGPAYINWHKVTASWRARLSGLAAATGELGMPSNASAARIAHVPPFGRALDEALAAAGRSAAAEAEGETQAERRRLLGEGGEA